MPLWRILTEQLPDLLLRELAIFIDIQKAKKKNGLWQGRLEIEKLGRKVKLVRLSLLVPADVEPFLEIWGGVKVQIDFGLKPLDKPVHLELCWLLQVLRR